MLLMFLLMIFDDSFFFLLIISLSQTSLLHSHKQKYEHERYKRRIECQPKSKQTIKEMEEKKRQAGLSKPLLDPMNKGFCLLQKMMNNDNKKVEESLETKQSSSQPDLSDEKSNKRKTVEELVMERRPIDIEFRIGRQGLGHESNKRIKSKDSNRSLMMAKKEKNLEIKKDKFLRDCLEKSEKLLAKKDYFSLQKICYNLDQSNNIREPSIEEWYWPKSFLIALRAARKNIESDEDDDEEEMKQENQDDLKQENQDDDDEDDDNIDYQERLQKLSEYVRQKYFYCLWCGCCFESNNDLNDNCPGNNRQLH